MKNSELKNATTPVVVMSPAYKTAGVAKGKDPIPNYGKFALQIPVEDINGETINVAFIATSGTRQQSPLTRAPLKRSDLDSSSKNRKNEEEGNETSVLFAPIYSWEEIPPHIAEWMEEGVADSSKFVPAYMRATSQQTVETVAKQLSLSTAGKAEWQRVASYVRHALDKIVAGADDDQGDLMSPDGSFVYLKELHLSGTPAVAQQTPAPAPATDAGEATPAQQSGGLPQLVIVPLVEGKHKFAFDEANSLLETGAFFWDRRNLSMISPEVCKALDKCAFGEPILFDEVSKKETETDSALCSVLSRQKNTAGQEVVCELSITSATTLRHIAVLKEDYASFKKGSQFPIVGEGGKPIDGIDDAKIDKDRASHDSNGVLKETSWISVLDGDREIQFPMDVVVTGVQAVNP